MEVKANVQKRRQDRIKALQSRSFNLEQKHSPAVGQNSRSYGFPADHTGFRQGDKPELNQIPDSAELMGPGDGGPPAAGTEEMPLWIRGPMPQSEDHGGDPEIAWKQRQKQLLEWYSAGGEEYASPATGHSVSRDSGSRGSRYDGGFTGGNGGGPLRKLVAVKLSVAIILFLGTWALFSMNAPWAQRGQAYVTDMLTTDMKFTQVAAWYNRTFSGAPSFLPAFGDKQEATKVQGKAVVGHFVQPVKGTVAQPFSVKKEGIWLATRSNAQVASMDEGRIEFVGEKEGTGHTIVVRHTDGYQTTYGGLAVTKWETGDWLKSGEVLGTVAAGTADQGLVFVAVMHEGTFINPLDVVSFD